MSEMPVDHKPSTVDGGDYGRNVSADAEEKAPEPFVLRETWDRFDKVWWLGSTVFYGLPCILILPGLGQDRVWWAFALVALLLIGFGWLNWHIRAVRGNRLIAEVTVEGIRFTDDQRPMPWSDVAWVGRHHTPSGTWGPQSRDYIVLHRHDGSQIMRPLDVDLWQVLKAITRLAPQIPLSQDDNPPQ